MAAYMSNSEKASKAPAGLPARKAALAILSDVLRRKRPLDVAVDDALAAAKLEPRDAGFARAIATTSLRRFGQLEALLLSFLDKTPPPHKAGPTLEILTAGACELLFLGVAPHAAVDGANRLAQADAKAVHFKGLINAVLRRIAREGEGRLAEQDARRLNTPDWLFERWLENYGEEAAHAIVHAHLLVPPLDLTLKRPDDPCTDLIGVLKLAPRRVRLEHAGRIEDLPGFAAGRWWVQDFAASLPAELLGPIEGRRVIDLCAAPGGKTAQLAFDGARVTAVDRSPARMARLRDNLARLELQANEVVTDAAEWPGGDGTFDGVLVDAPCTSTGTIRRHPDVAWLRQENDIAALTALQKRLLQKAVALLKPGGTLVYCTCSLEPEEGEQAIAALLAGEPAVRRAPVDAGEVAGLAEIITANGDLRTLPCHLPHADPRLGGLDGFYAARLVKS